MLLKSSILEPEPIQYLPEAENKVWEGKRTGIRRPLSQAVESKGIDYLISRAMKEKSHLDKLRPLSGILHCALLV